MTYYSSRPKSGSASSYRSRPAHRRPAQNRSSRKPMGQYIDPSRFVAEATPPSEDTYVATHTFSDFDLQPVLQANVERKGYTIPSPIQDQAIPIGLTGRDVLGIARTGSGKTAAFAIPVLERLVTDPSSAALIIAPTRELAQQIEGECRDLGKGTGLMGALLIGGSSMGLQLRDLRANPRIIIGTPGRINDHLERGSLDLSHFTIVVLDEVDRMLDMGFVRPIRAILDCVAEEHQSFFFSATMTAEIRSLIDTFTNDPEVVKIHSPRAGENVHQNVVRYTDASDKFAQLTDILQQDGVHKAIIFDETQRGVERLYKSLDDHGFLVDSMHGGKNQSQRQRALKRFKNNEINFLIATDVAARGIDVADVTHVINYSIPQTFDDYIHRVGRAGRAGRTGHALTFVEKR